MGGAINLLFVKIGVFQPYPFVVVALTGNSACHTATLLADDRVCYNNSYI